MHKKPLYTPLVKQGSQPLNWTELQFRRFRSISPAVTALSSKPTACRCCRRMMGQTDRQTDIQTDARLFHRPCSAYYRSSSVQFGGCEPSLRIRFLGPMQWRRRHDTTVVNVVANNLCPATTSTLRYLTDSRLALARWSFFAEQKIYVVRVWCAVMGCSE